MRLFLLISLCVGAVSAGAESRQAAVNRAIEQTKSRLTMAQAPARPVNKNAAQSPGRSESIDVDRLNKLIRALDKTWVLPKSGAKDPIGSNFQYKKTCSSIYKARHGACQQLGFGVMCFNYCHERGEKLVFKCQDASDAAYCRQSGTFDTFIAKYRKDAYKAKAYIHQMLSRCYATTVCNTQTGLLNSSIIEEEEVVVEKTTRMNRLKLLTRRPTTPAASATTEPTPEEIELVASTSEEVEETTTTTTTTTQAPTTSKPAKKSGKVQPPSQEKKRASPRPKTKVATPEVETTTIKANIWDKFTVGLKGKPTAKYIPFWQKLMSTTNAPTSVEETEKSEETTPTFLPEESVEPEEEEEVTEKSEEESTTMISSTTTKRNKSKSKTVEKKVVEQKTQKNPAEKSIKHTFMPLPVTVPAPQGPELAYQKPIDQHTEQEPGFWNRFQPNRWFQSIHYMTNTGK